MANPPQSRDDLIAEIIRRYRSGQSIRAVAAGIQRSYGLVQRILKQAGVAVRSPGRVSEPVADNDDLGRDAAIAAHPSAGADSTKKTKKTKKAKKAKKAVKKKVGKKMSKKDKAKKDKAKKVDKAKKAKKATAKKTKKSKKGKK